MTGLDAGGLAAIAMLGIGVVAAVVNMVLLHTAKDTDGNVVPADVQGLADAAGVSPDVYALARVSASEAGGQKQIAKQGVCWVVINHANAVNTTPLLTILGSAPTFGHQGTGGRSFVASGKDPGAVDLQVADDVFSGNVADPTGGALNFDSPGAYKDKLDNDGNVIATAQERADAFAAARQGENKVLVLLDGVSESTFRFWRPA